MYRFLILLFVLVALISCLDKKEQPIPPVVIPGNIDGIITELNVTPIDINTPDKGSFLISGNNTIYNVSFDAVSKSQSNADLIFATDTLLTNESREFASFGKDEIAYIPLKENEITIFFKDGGKISGLFDPYTTFHGVFGQDLISKWRDISDPAKPNQKAKDDLINFIHRYSDKDGPGAGTAPVYLLVTVSKR